MQICIDLTRPGAVAFVRTGRGEHVNEIVILEGTEEEEEEERVVVVSRKRPRQREETTFPSREEVANWLSDIKEDDLRFPVVMEGLCMSGEETLV
jgi:hypothetical protein